jgi:putative tricarboxylic transport membrane protein
MDILSNLWLGATVAVSPVNLLYCLIGTLLGTLIGVLPGVGPIATIAMLLPITFSLEPVAALIMLSGIYYGAQYGGSTTAILVNVPGEVSSVVTTIDGYQMARQGRAGPALAIAAIGSFFAGCVATLLIALAAPPLGAIALKFTSADYFSLMVLGLVAATALAHGSFLKAIGMVLLGLAFATVGTDIHSGVPRFTFGLPSLSNGFEFAALAMGIFGVTEIVMNLERRGSTEVFTKQVTHLYPTKDDLRRSAGPIVRGTLLGSTLGILPGGGAMLSSFGSYVIEKKLSKTPERFGKGAIEGVAGPESANNAGAQASFIPMLTLGIPSNVVMALMIGALMIQGIVPGPQVMTTNPSLFWGLVVSMWIGNLMLVILNLPLVGIWIKLLQVPYRLLYPSILVFMCVGVYSLSNNPWDCLLMALFGLFGILCAKLDCEPAPMLLGLILGPQMEEHLRTALLLSRGDATVFINPTINPISFGFLLVTLVLVILIALPAIRKGREKVFQE